MANRPLFFRSTESFEDLRQRMLDETARFIAWGLAHPDEVRRIPTRPVGQGRFSERVKGWFWSVALRDVWGPPDE